MFIPNIKLLYDQGQETDKDFNQWKLNNNLTIYQPFCLHFHKKNKIFNYIGARHTINKKSATYKLIRKIIKKYKPELIVIEGIPNKLGLNPNIDDWHWVGESQYAIDMGKKYGCNYVGIEPDEEFIYKKLIKKGIKVDDIYGYIFLRWHTYSYSTLHVTKQKFINEWEKIRTYHLDREFKKHKWDYQKWYLSRFHEKFKYGSNINYADPYGQSKIITQNVSYEFGKIRNIFDIKKLYKYLNKYNNVLYIMGMNHPFADKDVLIDTFGNYNLLQ